ncbi:hypothetical protein H4W79_003704 [Nocardiopsis terrae]|uniref:MalT-like TPR region domain-containing protein n=1 Tax=Nocardiopsis terrae TaxID=372655 RepID=A0ABR9HKD3_9ACTN|nr:hypothetical protein [Nocardiopsis terrae]MBE1459490.1 hypothetical protein [Nocardiopsis terrae]
MHGNELRKAGRGGAAIARLTEAAELSRNGQERGQTLILLARAAGEQGNAVLLDDSVTAAERLMDTAGPSGILFAPFSLREVHMRGLMGIGRAAMAAGLAQSRPGSGEAPAPQWAAIEAVTSADTLSAAGDLCSAHALYDKALSLAVRHRLPHQVQRVVRSAGTVGLEEIQAEAIARLRDLGQHRTPADSLTI